MQTLAEFLCPITKKILTRTIDHTPPYKTQNDYHTSKFVLWFILTSPTSLHPQKMFSLWEKVFPVEYNFLHSKKRIPRKNKLVGPVKMNQIYRDVVFIFFFCVQWPVDYNIHQRIFYCTYFLLYFQISFYCNLKYSFSKQCLRYDSF